MWIHSWWLNSRTRQSIIAIDLLLKKFIRTSAFKLSKGRELAHCDTRQFAMEMVECSLTIQMVMACSRRAVEFRRIGTAVEHTGWRSILLGCWAARCVNWSRPDRALLKAEYTCRNCLSIWRRPFQGRGRRKHLRFHGTFQDIFSWETQC